MSYQTVCDVCGYLLDDCQCERYYNFCPISVYDPANHPDDINDCPFCVAILEVEQAEETEELREAA